MFAVNNTEMYKENSQQWRKSSHISKIQYKNSSTFKSGAHTGKRLAKENTKQYGMNFKIKRSSSINMHSLQSIGNIDERATTICTVITDAFRFLSIFSRGLFRFRSEIEV